MEIRRKPGESGHGVEIWADLGKGAERLASVPFPIAVEILHDSTRPGSGQSRINLGYREVREDGDGVLGLADFDREGCGYSLEDRWRVTDGSTVTVERRLRMSAPAGNHSAARLVLDVEVTLGHNPRFADFKFFAPPALYDLNDINADGIEDYLDTRELLYRDDRLTGLAVLGYSVARGHGIALTREDLPRFDDNPERQIGQLAFAQRTDIGSLGVMPGQHDEPRLVATYPFVERSRSHALTAKAREPWGAFWPCSSNETLEASYSLQLVPGKGAADALWTLWGRRMAALSPKRVELPVSLEEIATLRLQAMVPFYAEIAGKMPMPAGFVTNCHPQDGVQLANVLQYGFTGLMVLSALHFLEDAAKRKDGEERRKGLRTIDFFVQSVLSSPRGLIGTLYNMDKDRPTCWWHGLLLPLAYAEEGDDLEKLMGPIYEHMRYAVDAMKGLTGTYFRCMCEEQYALNLAYEFELKRGIAHEDWLAAARRFGDFLLETQEPDGSWRRAYTLGGEPITEPRRWFGETELHQKAVTSTAIPVLTQLYRLTQEHRWLDAAEKAGRFVRDRYVREIRCCGALHDSIYSRAQLIDSEGVQFALRAMLVLANELHSGEFAAAALEAARQLCTWIYLWDVPLPPGSTQGRFGFRSTGWGAVDTCGIGFIDSRRLDAVPDLFEVAVASQDELVARMTDLTLYASNETVATPGRDWGYARPGLQQEGLLVSWWVVDDPMFIGTGFGSHGKGEGNKTYLAWISAIGVWGYTETMKRFGTTDLRAYWEKHVGPPSDAWRAQ